MGDYFSLRRVTVLLAVLLCAIFICALSACDNTVDKGSATFEVDYSNVRSEVFFDTKLDLSGLVVRLNFANNTYRLLPMGGEDGYAVDDGGYNRAVADTYTITISYKDYAPVRFDITVLETHDGKVEEDIVLQKISLKKVNRWTFFIDEEFSHDGLTLTKHFSDGSTQEITDGFSVDASGFNNQQVGNYTINVKFTTKGAEFSVKYTVTVVAES